MDTLDDNFINESDSGISLSPGGIRALTEAGKWARFIAIVAFVGLGLMVIGGIVMSAMMGQMSGEFESAGMGGMGAFMGVIYIVIALLYFLPVLYLYRFATKVINGIRSSSNHEVNDGLAQLKSHYKFIGILMLVMLGFYAIVIVFAGLGGAANMF